MIWRKRWIRLLTYLFIWIALIQLSEWLFAPGTSFLQNLIGIFVFGAMIYFEWVFDRFFNERTTDEDKRP